MNITHREYFVQSYQNGVDPELEPVKEQDFGFWLDFNDSYDSYDEALETLELSARHMSGDLLRIVVRTTVVTATEKVLYKHTTALENTEE